MMDSALAAREIEGRIVGDPAVSTVLLTGPTGSGKTWACRSAAGAAGASVRALDLLDAQSQAGCILMAQLQLQQQQQQQQQQTQKSTRNQQRTDRLDRFLVGAGLEAATREKRREVILVDDVDAALSVLPRAHVAAMLSSVISGAVKTGAFVVMTSTRPDPLSSSKALRDLRVDARIAIAERSRPEEEGTRTRRIKSEILGSVGAGLALDLVLLESLGGLPCPPWDPRMQ